MSAKSRFGSQFARRCHFKVSSHRSWSAKQSTLETGRFTATHASARARQLNPRRQIPRSPPKRLSCDVVGETSGIGAGWKMRDGLWQITPLPCPTRVINLFAQLPLDYELPKSQRDRPTKYLHALSALDSKRNRHADSFQASSAANSRSRHCMLWPNARLLRSFSCLGTT